MATTKPKRLTKDQLIERGDYYTARVMEPFRFWHKKHGWKKGYFRKNKLKLMAFSAKTSSTIQKTTTTNYTYRDYLKLPCGVIIDKGNSRIGSQIQYVTITNVRVDDIAEANAVLNDLSEIFNINVWEISKLQLHNVQKGPFLNFKTFNPDTTGVSLYLESAHTVDQFRYFYDIPMMEQQGLCNNIQDGMAHCEWVDRKTPQCSFIAAKNN